jgi:hypothetical protein
MAENMRKMGFDLGLSDPTTCFKRKFRWMLIIDDISGSLPNESGAINALPPLRSSRPSLSFKEMEAQHLNETIYFPSKPEWKPIPLSLYDIKKTENPIIKWLSLIYDAKARSWSPSLGPDPKSVNEAEARRLNSKKECKLQMYDGCGHIIESWIFENAWPQNIEFGELDMGASDVMTIDLTLRYDRAYIE